MSAEATFTIILEDESIHTIQTGGNPEKMEMRDASPIDYDLDGKLRRELDSAMAKASGTLIVSHESRVDVPQPTKNKHYEPLDYYVSKEFLAYAFASTAAGAVFVRNVLGILKDWRDLRTARSIKVLLLGKEIILKDGADIEEVLRKHLPDDFPPKQVEAPSKVDKAE